MSNNVVEHAEIPLQSYVAHHDSLLSNVVASGSDIASGNTINKPQVVYRFSYVT